MPNGTIDLRRPVNRAYPLHRNLGAWLVCLPGRMAGTRWVDAFSVQHGTLNNFGAGEGWSGKAPPGHSGSLKFLASQSRYVSFNNPLQATATTGRTRFTIAGWICYSGGSTQVFFDSRTNGALHGVVVYVNGADGKVNFLTNGPSTQQGPVTSAASVADGLWHCLIAVSDGANLKLSIDGGTFTSVAGAFAGGNQSQATAYLGVAGNLTAYADCWIDDVTLLLEPLTQGEATELYRESCWGNQRRLNYYSPVSSVLEAASFKVAWAGTANCLIGGGLHGCS